MQKKGTIPIAIEKNPPTWHRAVSEKAGTTHCTDFAILLKSSFTKKSLFTKNFLNKLLPPLEQSLPTAGRLKPDSAQSCHTVLQNSEIYSSPWRVNVYSK